MNAGANEVKGQPGVIFFDAAGTLLHLTRPVGWHYAKVAEDHGLAVDEAAMEAAFRTVWREAIPRAPSAHPREDDDRPWWRRLALETLRRAASPPRDFAAGVWFDDLYERFARPGVWALYEDVVPCLDALGSRVRLAVISNFDGRLRTILTGLGIADRFEHLFISSEVGAEKPSAEIFQSATTIMGAAPETCLHVGDDAIRDAAGARAAGLSAFLVQRPQNSLAEVAKLYV